jgi:hypothetical protein
VDGQLFFIGLQKQIIPITFQNQKEKYSTQSHLEIKKKNIFIGLQKLLGWASPDLEVELAESVVQPIHTTGN